MDDRGVAIRVTVAGDRLTLSRQQIIDGLNGQRPERVDIYGVEVGEQEYSAKQAISRATGKHGTTFNSYQAARWLKQLGFKVREHRSSGSWGVQRPASNGAAEVGLEQEDVLPLASKGAADQDVVSANAQSGSTRRIALRMAVQLLAGRPDITAADATRTAESFEAWLRAH